MSFEQPKKKKGGILKAAAFGLSLLSSDPSAEAQQPKEPQQTEERDRFQDGKDLPDLPPLLVPDGVPQKSERPAKAGPLSPLDLPPRPKDLPVMGHDTLEKN